MDNEFKIELNKDSESINGLFIISKEREKYLDVMIGKTINKIKMQQHFYVKDAIVEITEHCKSAGELAYSMYCFMILAAK